MKKCSNCNVEKNIMEFFKKPNNKEGYLSICKSCHAEKSKIYREKNSEKLKKYKKEYREKNLDNILQKEKEYRENLDKNAISEYNKKWRKLNIEKCKEDKRNYYLENKEYFKEKQKNYYLENKDKVKLHRENYKEKRNLNRKNRNKTDILYYLGNKIRSLLYSSFNRRGFTKKSRTYEILGCSFEEFKLHLESKFESWMTWENRGLYNGELQHGWDIDHIIPLDTAKTEEDIIKLNHYTNLQPLCSYYNRYIKKSNIL
jgi:hypothetical protein